MKLFRIVVVALVVGLSAELIAQSNLSAEAQLKAAMNREIVTRDLTGAIELYKQIVTRFAANHPVASKALLQLGGIYERIGRPEAPEAYQRIVAEYADTGATYASARARLNAIQEASAGPFKWRSLDPWLKDALNVTPSPDGKYVVYARSKPGQDTRVTYRRDLSSGGERVLIDSKAGENVFGGVFWSPDSKRIAVCVNSVAGLEHRVVVVATGETRTVGKGLLAAVTFSWAPDSRSLAFALKTSKEDDFEQRAVSVVTKGDSLLIDTVKGAPPALTWSPDGRRVAYLVNGATADTIRIKTPGTETVTSIEVAKASPTARTSISRWIPGDDILFVQTNAGGNDHYLVSTAGGAPRKICEGRGSAGGDGCQGLSPDGTLLITRKNATGGGRIMLRRIKDGSEHALTPEAVMEQTALGFSPDGRLFGFRSNREGGHGFYLVPTDALPVAAPVKIVALDSEASSVGGRWTPAGMILRISNDQTNQYRVDLDARTRQPLGPPVRLTEESPTNTTVQISPDGKRIAYISRGRPTGIALMDDNGGRERVIKEVPREMLGRMNLIGWLSDSELLISDARLGTGALRSAPKHLMRLNIATGEMREAGPAVDGSGLYMTSGGSLAYNAGGTLLTRSISAGPVRPLSVHKDWWDYIAAGPWVAYATGDDSGGPGKPIPGDLRVRSIETGAERIVAKFAETNGGDHAPLDVSRDGKYLLYQEPSLRIMMANVETGESWAVLKNPPAGVDFEYAEARMSPDGTYVIVEGYTPKATWRVYGGVTYDAVKKIIGPKK